MQATNVYKMVWEGMPFKSFCTARDRIYLYIDFYNKETKSIQLQGQRKWCRIFELPILTKRSRNFAWTSSVPNYSLPTVNEMEIKYIFHMTFRLFYVLKYYTSMQPYLLGHKMYSLKTISQARNQHEAGRTATLNMGATCSSETSVDFKRTTRRYISEDRGLHTQLGESYTF
jgi:hypothetical protein